MCHRLISHLFQIKFCGYEATKLYKRVSNRCGALCRSRLTIRPEDGSVAPKTCSRENKLGFVHILRVLWWLLIAWGRNRPWLILARFSNIYMEWVRKVDRLAIVSVLFSVTYGLECWLLHHHNEACTMTMLTQLFTVALNYMDDMFRPKIMTTIMSCNYI